MALATRPATSSNAASEDLFSSMKVLNAMPEPAWPLTEKDGLMPPPAGLGLLRTPPCCEHSFCQ
eukprot:7378567-Pyramimonas_sp.AAC.1